MANLHAKSHVKSPRKKNGKGYNKFDKEFSGQKLTRFARDVVQSNRESECMAERFRHHSVLTIQDVLALSGQGYSRSEIADMTGIPWGTVDSWITKRRLPRQGLYTKENFLLAGWAAKRAWLRGEGSEITCFRKACADRKMKWASVKVYMCYELVPAVPGFRIYQDPSVQVRAEAFGAGKLASSHPYYEATIRQGSERHP